MDYDKKPVLAGLHPTLMLIFSSLGVIVCGVVFQLIGVLLAATLFDVGIFDLTNLDGVEDKNVINALKLLQIIGALGTFIFSSLLLSFLYTGRWTGYFQFGRDINFRAIILLGVIMIAALPFVNLLTDLNLRLEIPIKAVEKYLRGLEEQTESLMMTLISAENISGLLINLFMIAIIPAIGEELVFRGLIQKHLGNIFRNGHIAILVAAAIFSLVHFQFYSFLPRFFLGLILGYAFYYGKSIWYPMIAHLVNNGLGVMFYYYYLKDQANESIEDIGTMEMMPYMALLSLIVVAALFYIWIKMVRVSEIPRPHQAEKDPLR